MTARRRVVVTGLGLATPHGRDPAQVFEALCAGRSAVRKVPTGEGEVASEQLLATCPVDADDIVPRAQRFLMDRVSRLAVPAAHDALECAGLLSEGRGPERAAVYMGCGLGGSQALEDGYRTYFVKRRRRTKPTTVPLIMANAPAAHISMLFGLRGPTLSYSIACASSAVAIGEAFRAIRHGHAEVALAGGAEAMLNDGTLVAWESLGVLASEHPDGPEASSRPFDAQRTGFVLGEGAAALVLESEEAAAARGAEVLGEVAGYGASSDAFNLTQPAAPGQVTAMEAALADSGLDRAAVGYVNAHATATEVGDVVEIEALKAVFGDHAHRLAVSSTKSMHGHLVGAAGALEAAITLMALQQGRIPPTANLTDPDPRCDLDCVPDAGRTAPGLEAALSNSFAFGGSNAVLVLRRA